jgi:dihydroflavonol-4-reductase
MAAIAYGLGDKRNETLDEDTWTNIEGADVSAYIMSKTLAERKAWEIVEAAGKKDILTVINPGFILGPVLENDIGTSGEIILKMLNGGFPGCPHMAMSCVDVRDVAAIHIGAMDNKEFAGQRCIAGGQSIQMVELARILAKEFPTYAKKLPTRQLPDFVVRLVGLFDGDTRSVTKSLGHKVQFKSERAKKLLGGDLISDDVTVNAMAKSIIDLGLA